MSDIAYYITDTQTDRAGGIAPDVPEGVSYCCAYGEMNGSPVAFVKCDGEIEPGMGRVRRTTDQEITDAMRDMGSRLPERDPIDRWRIGGR